MSTSVALRDRLSWPLVQGAYVWFVMAGLLVQGTGSLVLALNQGLRDTTPYLLATIMNGNPPHAWLHILWGAGGLVFLGAYRTLRARLGLGFVFGIFYTLLGFLGVVVHDPFGMRLAWEENTFHLTVGPLMLLLSFLAYRERPA
jgi:hypothetical protein